jgi:hypothetical protein
MNDKTKEVAPVMPLKLQEFGTQAAHYRMHNASAPAGIKKSDLENPKLWENVARRVSIGDEIRVFPVDCSFRALLIVTAAIASQIRVKLVEYTVLDNVDDIEAPESAFDVVLKGPRKWCIVDKKTGENIMEDIPTKLAAHKEVDDRVRALAR